MLAVIIPVKDGESTIAGAIQSAWASSADEVVVVADGCLDSTAKIARNLGARVVETGGVGAAAARRRGLEEVAADYVCFLDADDALIPEGVGASLEILRTSAEYIAAGGGVALRYPGGRVTERRTPASITTVEGLLASGVAPWPPGAQVTRRAAVVRAVQSNPPLVEPKFAEDYELVVRLAAIGRIAHHPKLALEYRIYGGRSTRDAFAAVRDREVLRKTYSKTYGTRITVLGRRAMASDALSIAAQHAGANGGHVKGFAYAAAAVLVSPGRRLRKVLKRLQRRPASSVREAAVCVIAPWLQGGGGQRALVGLIARVAPVPVDVIVLFGPSRNYEPVEQAARKLILANLPRNPLGLIRAVGHVRRAQGRYSTVLSLMRGSHVVMGVAPPRISAAALAMSFHQLPSIDDADRHAWLENILVRRAVRGASIVTTPSELGAAQLRARYPFAAQRIVTDPNVLLPLSDRPTVAPGGLQDGEQLVVFSAGRLDAQKGYDLLPRMAEELAPSLPVMFKIAGDGPDRAILQRQFEAVASSNVAIELVGHIGDVAEALDSCHVALLLSRWELNPMFVWEAWSRGRAVIVPNLPVFVELAKRGPLLLMDSHTSLSEMLEKMRDAVHRRKLYTDALSAFAQGQIADSSLVDFLVENSDRGAGRGIERGHEC
ncbi:glycosyltransferase [Actinotalea sp. JY-7885]|uniref:glycosyltransferase n=1 Tax=Actinotalea sp. JY-7885 TaxID=2758576 RepID=UPI001CB715E3|nr:glycosyltransferase [Actinotalea sp. JY-7885]